MRLICLILSMLLAGMFAACDGGGSGAEDGGSRGGGDAGADSGPGVCQPLVTRECNCEGGEKGVQICLLTGDGWTDCACGESGTVDTDMDGGAEGGALPGDPTDTDTGTNTESVVDTDTAQCTVGRCCKTSVGQLRPLGFSCNTYYEYRCAGDGCGEDAEVRAVEQRCTGESPDCDGLTVEYAWQLKEVCGENELCTLNSDGESTCTPCGTGSWCHTDTCERCNTADHCGPGCVACVHGCDSVGDACRAECNPATDPCCELNGLTCANGCDGVNCCDHGFSGTGCYPECNPITDPCCDTGGLIRANTWLDITTGLCWQETPTETNLEFDEALIHCSNIGPGWRVPKIEELKTLLRTCPSAMQCEVHGEGCPSEDCIDGCNQCTYNEDGTCHWDTDQLNGHCTRYWSSSHVYYTGTWDDPMSRWIVGFGKAELTPWEPTDEAYVRCVRSVPSECDGYIETFEDEAYGGGYYSASTVSGWSDSWEIADTDIDIGGGAIIRCRSQDSCLCTNRDGDYGTCDSSAVYSPFFDLSFCAKRQLTFYNWYRFEGTEERWADGAMLEFSRNGGIDWEQTTPNASNPYQGVINGLGCVEQGSGHIDGKLGWSGGGGDYWHKVAIDIPEKFMTSQFMFRFIYGSDETTTDKGWVIDDIAIVPASTD